MTKIVKFDNFSEVPAADLNAISTLHRSALDYIVQHLLFDEARYVGYDVAEVDAFNLTVAVGALITGGKVFDTSTVTSLSVTSLLPSSNYRSVLVVVSGEEVETDTAVRKFLTDVSTRTTQPKATTTRIARQAGVELIAGTAAASPSRPAVPAGSLVVASFTISPTGIVDSSLEMETDNSAYSLENTVASVAVLNANLKKTTSLLTTLRSDLATLAKAQQGYAPASAVSSLLGRVSSMEKHVSATESRMLVVAEKLDLPDTSSFDGYDTFNSTDESDTGNAAYTAQLEAGRIRFAPVERATKMTALLNPNDSKLDITTAGLIMPKGTDTLRIECDDKDAEVAIASYAVTTTEVRQKTLVRTYYWYAPAGLYLGGGQSAPTAYFAGQKQVRLYDPILQTYTTIDLTAVKWEVLGTVQSNCWRLRVTSTYWDQDEVTKTFTGARLAQTFLCAQSGWHRRIDLGFTSIGATGDVHLMLCKLTDAGYPDENEVLETATVSVANLKKWPTWTPFQFDPVWLEKGERYGIIIVTTGNHKLGMSQSNDLTNGTLMTWTAGSIWSLDLAEDVCFRLYGIRYDATQVLIELEDVTLTGGITELQAITTGYEPDGTALIIQGRIAGVWRNIDESDGTVLAGKPTQIPLRFLFRGTKDVMPAINLNKSALVASRPNASAVHISTERTLPAGVTTTEVIVKENAAGFVEASHDWTVSLLTGAGYATEIAATAVKTVDPVSGITGRTWRFAGLAAISAYKIKTTMQTSDVATIFDVTARSDSAAG